MFETTGGKNRSQGIKVVIEPEFGLLFDFYYLREFQLGDNSLPSLLIHAWYVTDEYSITQWLGAGTGL